MATIETNFGSGGANLVPSGSAKPTLATALRDVADDLTALKGALGSPVTVVSPNAGTATSADAVAAVNPDATDLPSALLLVNELKANYNTAVTLINELKADYNAAVALINEMKVALNALDTAAGGVTLKTVKG